MSLNKLELDALAANSLGMESARTVATHIESDTTMGGIFPNAQDGNFNNPDIAKFKDKWCDWWPVAKILLKIAKVFTGEKGDKAIDAILKLGNEVCD